MWKDIEFNPNYEISDLGIVRRKNNKNVLKGCITSGYRSVKLTFNNSNTSFFLISTSSFERIFHYSSNLL